MSKAMELKAARVEARLGWNFKPDEGYEIGVYHEGCSLVAWAERDGNTVTHYLGDGLSVREVAHLAGRTFDKLDRDDDENPARDEDGQPINLTVYS